MFHDDQSRPFIADPTFLDEFGLAARIREVPHDSASSTCAFAPGQPWLKELLERAMVVKDGEDYCFARGVYLSDLPSAESVKDASMPESER